MEHSRILKFQSMVYDLDGDEMAKRIMFGLLNKSESLSKSVHFLVPEEDKDNLQKLVENEIIKNCFANLETNFKFNLFRDNEGKQMIMLSNANHLSSQLLSQKEVLEIDLEEDPYFKALHC